MMDIYYTFTLKEFPFYLVFWGLFYVIVDAVKPDQLAPKACGGGVCSVSIIKAVNDWLFTRQFPLLHRSNTRVNVDVFVSSSPGLFRAAFRPVLIGRFSRLQSDLFCFQARFFTCRKIFLELWFPNFNTSQMSAKVKIRSSIPVFFC